MYFYASYDDYRGKNPDDCSHRFTRTRSGKVVCLDCDTELDEVDPDNGKKVTPLRLVL